MTRHEHISKAKEHAKNIPGAYSASYKCEQVKKMFQSLRKALRITINEQERRNAKR